MFVTQEGKDEGRQILQMKRWAASRALDSALIHSFYFRSKQQKNRFEVMHLKDDNNHDSAPRIV